MARMKVPRVLITGASSGIGKATALAFARRGAKLVLASRNFCRLEEVASQIKNAYPDLTKPVVVSCDVTSKRDVKRLIRSAVDCFGGIDILINNAGIGVYGESERTALEDFRSVMEVNFFGAIQCILEVLPVMKKAGKGLIVNIASVAAKHGIPYLGAYSASKAALAALSQSFRAELSKSGISIMIVYPGYTQTDFFKKEKKVGGAHRPPEPYASVQNVARAIIRAIENGRRDLILSLEGKILALSQGIAPWIIEKALEKTANKLRDK